jgi:hypothetical protein
MDGNISLPVLFVACVASTAAHTELQGSLVMRAALQTSQHSKCRTCVMPCLSAAPHMLPQLTHASTTATTKLPQQQQLIHNHHRDHTQHKHMRTPRTAVPPSLC